MASHTEGGPVSEADIARFKGWVQNVPAAPDTASSDTQPGDLREKVAAIIDANKYEAWTVDRANQMADAILSIIQSEEDKKRVAELLETTTRYLLRARKSEELLQTLIDKSMGHIHTRHLTDAQEHLKDPWA